MTYFFAGVFAAAGPKIMRDLIAAQGGVGREIEAPFKGFGVSFASDHDKEGAFRSFDAGPLLPWSARWPGVGFAFLRVTCFGGRCDQAGFAFANGATLVEVDWADAEGPRRRIFEAAGLPAGEDCFEPLTRRFFR